MSSLLLLLSGSGLKIHELVTTDKSIAVNSTDPNDWVSNFLTSLAIAVFVFQPAVSVFSTVSLNYKPAEASFATIGETLGLLKPRVGQIVDIISDTLESKERDYSREIEALENHKLSRKLEAAYGGNYQNLEAELLSRLKTDRKVIRDNEYNLERVQTAVVSSIRKRKNKSSPEEVEMGEITASDS